jgi:hypothetical protein
VDRVGSDGPHGPGGPDPGDGQERHDGDDGHREDDGREGGPSGQEQGDLEDFGKLIADLLPDDHGEEGDGGEAPAGRERYPGLAEYAAVLGGSLVPDDPQAGWRDRLPKLLETVETLQALGPLRVELGELTAGMRSLDRAQEVMETALQLAEPARQDRGSDLYPRVLGLAAVQAARRQEWDRSGNYLGDALEWIRPDVNDPDPSERDSGAENPEALAEPPDSAQEWFVHRTRQCADLLVDQGKNAKALGLLGPLVAPDALTPAEAPDVYRTLLVAELRVGRRSMEEASERAADIGNAYIAQDRFAELGELYLLLADHSGRNGDRDAAWNWSSLALEVSGRLATSDRLSGLARWFHGMQGAARTGFGGHGSRAHFRRRPAGAGRGHTSHPPPRITRPGTTRHPPAAPERLLGLGPAHLGHGPEPEGTRGRPMAC